MTTVRTVEFDQNGPGTACDNTAYVVVSEQIEKIPFNDDLNEGLPDCYLRVFSGRTDTDYNPEEDICFSDEVDLVNKYYARKEEVCPIPVRRYHDLYGQTIRGADGEEHVIGELMLYLAAYGIEYENLYFVRCVPMVAAICDGGGQAEAFVEGNLSHLRRPRIVPTSKNTLLPDGLGCLFY